MLGNKARSYLHIHVAVRTLIDDFQEDRISKLCITILQPAHY